MAVEHHLQLAGELVQVWSLDRERLDEACAALGMPPMTEEEWALLRAVRPPKKPEIRRSHGALPGRPHGQPDQRSPQESTCQLSAERRG
jgi:hypothetical protein